MLAHLAGMPAQRGVRPTIDNDEDIPALAIYRENAKRAKALGDAIHPELVDKVLTDEHRAPLEAAKNDRHGAGRTPGGQPYARPPAAGYTVRRACRFVARREERSCLSNWP
jgi:hypothetical protein